MKIIQLIAFVATLAFMDWIGYQYGYQTATQRSENSFVTGYAWGFDLGKMFASPIAEVELSQFTRLEGVRFLSPVKIKCLSTCAIYECDLLALNKNIAVHLTGDRAYLAHSNFDMTAWDDNDGVGIAADIDRAKTKESGIELNGPNSIMIGCNVTIFDQNNPPHPPRQFR